MKPVDPFKLRSDTEEYIDEPEYTCRMCGPVFDVIEFHLPEGDTAFCIPCIGRLLASRMPPVKPIPKEDTEE